RGMEIFSSFIEVLVQAIISPFTNVNIGISSLFSVNNFYISEIPVKIVFSEIFYVFIFAVLSSTWAAYSASKIVSRYKPAEVLRYE
ncbi:MAG: ABC transporter permease, partial [Bacteroidetes bacterium]